MALKILGFWRKNRMLGRNAAGIYWMFRYLERCENSARLLRAGLRISITQSDYGSQDWDSVLTAASIRPVCLLYTSSEPTRP